MGLREDFHRAIQETEIHRHRQTRLLTYGGTELPYVWLGESAVNMGDTVVRRGVVRVEKPQLLLVQQPLQFEGFEYGEEKQESSAFLALGRIASFPPGKYSNIETRLDIYEGSLQQALTHYKRDLEAREDALTGLVSGPSDIWAVSLFVYVGKMVEHSAVDDIQELLRRHLRHPGQSGSGSNS
ncbi:MAG: hypothetical protein HYU36_05695 [Planctomycetes bacterium]|nr:hypothetical protein [Planctomycetota bacterium]